MTGDRRGRPPARRVVLVAVLLVGLVLAGLGLLRAAGSDGSPTLREQADAVAATLRCPTCQGMSIRDSSSVLAAGSRESIETQLAQGRTPDEVRQYFVDRYGEYVLLSPGTSGSGLLAWLLPVLTLLVATGLAWRWLRRSGDPPGAPATDQVDDEDAGTALTAFRAGTLVPDTSPAGDALHAALLARVAAEEDEQPDADGLRRADARLGAAYRRHAARAASPKARAASPKARSALPKARSAGPALPRRAVTVGVTGLLVATAGVAVVLGVQDRGVGDPATGGVPESAPEAPATGTDALVEAVRDRPQDPAVWVALGRAYDGSGQYAPALAAYDRALELEPAAEDLILLRANLLVRSGDPAEALPAMEELAGRYPEDPDVLLILGLAQEGAGDPEAAGTLRRFLELAPDSPAAPGVRTLLGER